MAHIGQELALGLIGALGAHGLSLVLGGQFRQFGGVFLQLAHRVLQRFLVAAQSVFLALQGGDVGGGHHQAAVGGAAFGNLQPTAVDHLHLPNTRAVEGGERIFLDGKVGHLLHQAVLGAGLQHARLQREEVAVILVAHDQPPGAVPQHEGFRHALDGVLQPLLGALGAKFGAAFVRHVQCDADDRGEALFALAETLPRASSHAPAALEPGT